MDSRSSAWDRFWKSTKIGYMEWRDGIGYDLAALGAMTDGERSETISLLRARAQDWRDVEAYGVINTNEARDALREALRSTSAETRLYAARQLHGLGEPIALDRFVAKELPSVTLLDGLMLALRIAAGVPTPEVRRALLDGVRHRPDVAYHFAETLCSLVREVNLSAIGGDLRRLLLRLGEHSPREDRRAAFRELCGLLGMDADNP
jgi:hypothetical protein